MSRYGDCYAVAGRAAIESRMGGPEIIVVHATVETETTPRHGHAWVEVQDEQGEWMVHDASNGHDVTLPQIVYYALGRVADVRRYSTREALELMTATGHFGPWGEETR